MYIKELRIEEFGALRAATVPLSNGINLLIGNNETGKSTLCAFIKFIFYGFADSKERELHASLRTGNSAGALVVSKDGVLYRIERRDAGRVRSVSVYDEETGLEITEWKNSFDTPGEYFLGVPPMLYPRSVYVSQSGGASLDGGSAEAVSNLLISGDEAISLKQAKKLLESARKELKLKKGRGGKIAECEDRLARLKTSLDEGLDLKKQIEGLTVELKAEEQKLDNVTRNLENARLCTDRANAYLAHTYLKGLDGAADELQRIAILSDQLIKDTAYGDFLPDAQYAEELRTVEKEISIYTEQAESISRQLEKLKLDLSLIPPEGYTAYCEMGKTEKILQDYQKNQSAHSILNIFMLSAGFLAIVSLLGVIGALMKLFTPSSGTLYTVLGITGFIAIFSAILRGIPEKRIRTMLTSLCAKGKTPHEVCRECDGYERRLSGSSSYLQTALEKAKGNLDRTRSAEKALLDKWNKTSYEHATAALKEYFEKLELYKSKRIKAENSVELYKAYLSRYTEEELARIRTLAPSVSEPASEQSVSREQLQELEAQAEAVRERVSELKVALAASGAGKIDAERLTFEIESETERLSKLNASYSAVELAIESLEAAERNIRQTVSPYLSRTASITFAALTEGKYSQLRLDSEMSLSYLSEGIESVTDSKYFSGGSASLAWLCLRLALHSRLSEGNPLPLILDEATVYFDERRLQLLLAELTKTAASGKQIILLSASERELRYLNNASVTRLT